MDGKFQLVFLCFLAAVGIIQAQSSYKAGNCPLRDSVSQCQPRCMSDQDCALTKKCCPNKCGSMSCAQSSAVNTGDDGGYKSSSRGTGITGTYCGNVKCSPYEKCQIDRVTKRERCVRT